MSSPEGGCGLSDCNKLVESFLNGLRGCHVMKIMPESESNGRKCDGLTWSEGAKVKVEN